MQDKGVHMDISYIETEMLIGFFKDMIAVGFLPGFMLCTALHLIGYGIFKGLTLLNIRS